ncbi:hypothetical protein ACQJBY_064734 [Aegilops geniculata]
MSADYMEAAMALVELCNVEAREEVRDSTAPRSSSSASSGVSQVGIRFIMSWLLCREAASQGTLSLKGNVTGRICTMCLLSQWIWMSCCLHWNLLVTLEHGYDTRACSYVLPWFAD